MTQKTKNYKKIYISLIFIQFLILILPLIIYTFIGFVNGEVVQKLALGCSIFSALILVSINFLFKLSLRSSIWILLLGLYSCIENLIPLLLIIAISTLIDELILTPQIKKYKQKFIINKEIDDRG